MAISTIHTRYVQSSRGQAVVPMAAYLAGADLYEEHTGVHHDYTRKVVEHSEILAPENAPAWVYDRELLWNAVQARGVPSTRRDTAVLACELGIGLPRELSRDAQLFLIREFLRDEVVALGLIADWSLHARPRERPHVHALVPVRCVDADGLVRRCAAWDRAGLIIRWREQWTARVTPIVARAPVTSIEAMVAAE